MRTTVLSHGSSRSGAEFLPLADSAPYFSEKFECADHESSCRTEEKYLKKTVPGDSLLFVCSLRHRQRWQAPEVPAELAKRVICACIREICFSRFSMGGPKVINFVVTFDSASLYKTTCVSNV